jgi:hypothetical protein
VVPHLADQGFLVECLQDGPWQGAIGKAKLPDTVLPAADDGIYHRAKAGNDQQEESARATCVALNIGALGRPRIFV